MEKLKSKLYNALRWSEKYTKTDMIYLASGGFWVTIGQTVSSLSAFALAVAFANLVPPETYGTYKYLLSIAAIFALFTLPGMNTAAARSVARGDTATIRIATRERVLWSFIGTLVAFAGASYYFINGNVELSLSLAIIGAILPFFDTFTAYNAFLVGKRNFKLQTIFHLISQAVSIISLITALFLTDNILLILLAYFIPLSLIRFLLYKRVSRHFTKEESDKGSLTYGKHLSLINVLGVVAGNIDKILLWKFLGPAQLAIYAFAIAIPEQIKGPIKGVAELAFPKFAQQTPEQIRENLPALWRKLGLYSLGLLGISILYILAAPYIFQFLFPQYMESVIYSQVFAISLLVSPALVAFKIFEAQKKTTQQYSITVVQNVIRIIALISLIPFFGIWGAIAGVMISRFFMMIFIFFNLQRL